MSLLLYCVLLLSPMLIKSQHFEFGPDFKDPSCDSPYVKIADSCYHVVQDSGNWTEAKKYCADEGASLAPVINSLQLYQIPRYLKRTSPGTYWIGGMTENNKWIWADIGMSVDANGFGYRNVPTGDGYCLYFCSRTLRYWPRKCRSTLRFICMKSRNF